MNIFSFFSSKTLSEINSGINKKIKVVEVMGKKIIYVAGAEQTGGTITGMWRKALRKLPATNLQTALILGLGGGDVIRLISKSYPDIKITAVEIDPVMINIAEKFFKLKDTPTLKIIKSDALIFLQNNHKKYGIIVVDLFIGKYNPEKFRSYGFFRLLKNNLNAEGLILYNSHYHADKPYEINNLLKVCRKVFPAGDIIVKYPFSRIILLK